MWGLWADVRVVSWCEGCELMWRLWADVKVVSRCEGCELMWGLWADVRVVSCEPMWGLWADVRVVSWCEGCELMWGLWADVRVVSWCEGCELWADVRVVSWCEGCELMWGLWVVSWCEGCELMWGLWADVRVVSCELMWGLWADVRVVSWCEGCELMWGCWWSVRYLRLLMGLTVSVTSFNLLFRIALWSATPVGTQTQNLLIMNLALCHWAIPTPLSIRGFKVGWVGSLRELFGRKKCADQNKHVLRSTRSKCFLLTYCAFLVFALTAGNAAAGERSAAGRPPTLAGWDWGHRPTSQGGVRQQGMYCVGADLKL